MHSCGYPGISTAKTFADAPSPITYVFDLKKGSRLRSLILSSISGVYSTYTGDNDSQILTRGVKNFSFSGVLLLPEVADDGAVMNSDSDEDAADVVMGEDDVRCSCALSDAELRKNLL